MKGNKIRQPLSITPRQISINHAVFPVMVYWEIIVGGFEENVSSFIYVFEGWL